VQFLVTTFVAGMLALSARQVAPSLYLQRPGSWLVRLCAVILLIVGWQFVDLELPLPLLTPQIEQLFLWLTVCSLILLGLSSSPLHTGVALIFWFIPIQVLVEILLPGYGLFVQIGMIELFVGLTCSYLLLAQRSPSRVVRHVLTDVAFPFDATPEPTSPRSGWAPRLENRLPSRASTEPLRRTPAQLPARPLPIGNDQPERWHSDEEPHQQLPDPLHSPSSEAHNRNGDGVDDNVTTDQSR
ncbi:MAG: hypothetical protein KDE53_27175, partial [Caldilineaceae bacterium]|nr:hypothetical protein [Caldilineaceae bacterium]